MPKPRVTVQQKAVVKQRARSCCEYCWSQEDFSPDTFSVEHIVPLAKGGANDVNNLAHACQGCNNRKFVSIVAIDNDAHVHVASLGMLLTKYVDVRVHRAPNIPAVLVLLTESRHLTRNDLRWSSLLTSRTRYPPVAKFVM